MLKQTHHKNGQLASEGEEIDGKKHGTWKWFYDNGQLEKQGEYEHGRPFGHFYFYYPNGQESANGRYENDDYRLGDWIWHFEDGTINQYGTYVEGKLHGPYQWNHQSNGAPSTIGAFHHGERDGKWVWTSPEGAVTYEMQYDKGKKNGYERKYSADGKILIYDKHWKNGQLHGDYLVNDENGNLIEQASYIDGFLDGEHIKVENGKKKKKQYDKGVPILTEKRWTSLANQINKKKDNYAKMSVMEKVADWGARARSIWFMAKEGFLDLDNHADLWSELKSDLNYLGAAEFIEILKTLKLNKKQLQHCHKFLSFWPMALDYICMHYYAQDPNLFDASLQDFSKNLQEGIKLVQIRFGNASQEILKIDMAKELADQQINHYGIGTQGGGVNGAFSNVYWAKDGKVIELNISKPERGGLPNEAFYELIESFTTKDAWEKALLAEALKKEWNLPMPQAMDAIRIANKEEFAQLFKAFSTSHFKDFYWALLELRNDSIEDLEWMAKELKEDWRPGQKAESIIIAAILRRKAAKKKVPEWYEELFTFDSYYNSKDHTGEYFMGIEHVEEALSYLDQASIDKLIDRQLDHDYSYALAIPFLNLTKNKDLWDKAIAVVSEKQKEDLVLSNLMPVYLGIPRLGKKGLTWLAAKIETAEKEHIRQLLVLAMICTLAKLADEGKTWGKTYDQFLELYNWPPKYGDDYDHYVASFFQKALWALPVARQIDVFDRLLDPEQPLIIRIFSLFNETTVNGVVKDAFKIISTRHIKKPNTNWVEHALRNGLKERAEAMVRHALYQGAEGQIIDWFKYAIGDDKLKALKKEVAEVLGKEVAKEKTKVEQYQDLMQAYLLKNPDTKTTMVYWLDRLNHAPKGNAISRVGGPAIGLDKDSMPQFDEEYMQHIFTLDIKALPSLAAKLPKGTAAVSLFVANPDHNEAYEPGNEQAELVFLTEEDLKTGSFSDDDYEPYTEATAVQVTEIEAPIEIFSEDYNRDDEDLKEIRNKLYNAPAYVMGAPIWLQSEEHFGQFLMQFDEKFASINLGDSGIMYVFSDTAFWQCY
jgi:antitoxin component YwqK of YwqJK toxin-antitoxin module